MKTESLFPATRAVVLATFALMWAAPQAQAVAVVTPSISGADVTATPGSSFEVNVDVDFGANTSVSSFTYDLTWDSPQLVLTGVSHLTYQGVSVDPNIAAAGFAAAGTFSQTQDPLGAHTTWFNIDSSFQPTPALNFSGPMTITYTFQLGAGVAPGATFHVMPTVTDYSDADLNTFGPIGTTITVAAVPEPATWALSLAGLVLVAGIARRGAARRA
ncbi:MAG: PEP-CTERM sorting domain-containing protein [Betaproteobacteria bacterium]|nr:PEP-CTERM sorting domain-containing protein [Betaproteobacteria bacterium]